jgi:hypothetical protein
MYIYFINREESKNKYLEMIEQYDYILFQSQTQANNLKSMLNGKKCKILVLTPGVSENDIQKAMQKGNILNKNELYIKEKVQKRHKIKQCT